MGIMVTWLKTWDEKKKCWHLKQSAKTLKQISSQLLTLIPGGGSLLKSISKQILIAKMKAKGFCSEDISWVKKNI